MLCWERHVFAPCQLKLHVKLLPNSRLVRASLCSVQAGQEALPSGSFFVPVSFSVWQLWLKTAGSYSRWCPLVSGHCAGRECWIFSPSILAAPVWPGESIPLRCQRVLASLQQPGPEVSPLWLHIPFYFSLASTLPAFAISLSPLSFLFLPWPLLNFPSASCSAVKQSAALLLSQVLALGLLRCCNPSDSVINDDRVPLLLLCLPNSDHNTEVR